MVGGLMIGPAVEDNMLALSVGCLTLHGMLTLRRIHDPVPIFNKEILKPVNAFMTRITPTKPFWRANWTVRHHLCLGCPGKVACHSKRQPASLCVCFDFNMRR